MKRLLMFAAAAVALSGCASLTEQRTMRLVFCPGDPAPIASLAGRSLDLVGVMRAVQNEKIDRVIVSSAPGALSFARDGLVAQLAEQAGVRNAIVFADSMADRAGAQRQCEARS